ncbi:hypothetical protein PG996_010772 [Apiospora saccharicola]|uniref:Apple domain-containing protein n=1 Tax=Apiospora saccharicola TaxID=335842 RepID=A0ABR1UPJ7_9PEZI
MEDSQVDAEFLAANGFVYFAIGGSRTYKYEKYLGTKSNHDFFAIFDDTSGIRTIAMDKINEFYAKSIRSPADVPEPERHQVGRHDDQLGPEQHRHEQPGRRAQAIRRRRRLGGLQLPCVRPDRDRHRDRHHDRRRHAPSDADGPRHRLHRRRDRVRDRDAEHGDADGDEDRARHDHDRDGTHPSRDARERHHDRCDAGLDRAPARDGARRQRSLLPPRVFADVPDIPLTTEDIFDFCAGKCVDDPGCNSIWIAYNRPVTREGLWCITGENMLQSPLQCQYAPIGQKVATALFTTNGEAAHRRLYCGWFCGRGWRACSDVQ